MQIHLADQQKVDLFKGDLSVNSAPYNAFLLKFRLSDCTLSLNASYCVFILYNVVQYLYYKHSG